MLLSPNVCGGPEIENSLKHCHFVAGMSKPVICATRTHCLMSRRSNVRGVCMNSCLSVTAGGTEWLVDFRMTLSPPITCAFAA